MVQHAPARLVSRTVLRCLRERCESIPSGRRPADLVLSLALWFPAPSAAVGCSVRSCFGSSSAPSTIRQLFVRYWCRCCPGGVQSDMCCRCAQESELHVALLSARGVQSGTCCRCQEVVGFHTALLSAMGLQLGSVLFGCSALYPLEGPFNCRPGAYSEAGGDLLSACPPS